MSKHNLQLIEVEVNHIESQIDSLKYVYLNSSIFVKYCNDILKHYFINPEPTETDIYIAKEVKKIVDKEIAEMDNLTNVISKCEEKLKNCNQKIKELEENDGFTKS